MELKKNQIFTGSYFNCKYCNLISISGDRGKNFVFHEKAISEFAQKLNF